MTIKEHEDIYLDIMNGKMKERALKVLDNNKKFKRNAITISVELKKALKKYKQNTESVIYLKEYIKERFNIPIDKSFYLVKNGRKYNLVIDSTKTFFYQKWFKNYWRISGKGASGSGTFMTGAMTSSMAMTTTNVPVSAKDAKELKMYSKRIEILEKEIIDLEAETFAYVMETPVRYLLEKNTYSEFGDDIITTPVVYLTRALTNVKAVEWHDEVFKKFNWSQVERVANSINFKNKNYIEMMKILKVLPSKIQHTANLIKHNKPITTYINRLPILVDNNNSRYFNAYVYNRSLEKQILIQHKFNYDYFIRDHNHYAKVKLFKRFRKQKYIRVIKK